MFSFCKGVGKFRSMMAKIDNEEMKRKENMKHESRPSKKETK